MKYLLIILNIIPLLGFAQFGITSSEFIILEPLVNDLKIEKITITEYADTSIARKIVLNKNKNLYSYWDLSEISFEMPLNEVAEYKKNGNDQCDTTFSCKSGTGKVIFIYKDCNIDRLIKEVPVGATQQTDTAFYYYNKYNVLDSITIVRNCADLRTTNIDTISIKCKEIEKEKKVFYSDEQGRIIEVREIYHLKSGTDFVLNWFKVIYLANEIKFVDIESDEIMKLITFANKK